MEYVKGDKCFETLDRNEYLLFYFGAGWCGPCKEAGPKFEELATKYPTDKIKFFKVLKSYFFYVFVFPNKIEKSFIYKFS